MLRQYLPMTETDLREAPERFRQRFRQFLHENHPGSAPKSRPERLAWQKAWNATLVDGGFGSPSWPVRYGGSDLPFAHQVVYSEEFARAKVPGPLGTGVGIAGPTIVRHGTEEQRERWLRPMLRADRIWAQGYSEPDAGSDLPSLRTVAVRDGDHYVVTGQKVWSSSAEIADILFCLVRTGPPGSRQDGITYLIVDAHAPGVAVSPIRDLTGRSDFCEIHLDGVVVPVADRIGDENGGWAITRTSLGHERAAGAMNQAHRYRRIVDELHVLARSRGIADDPIVRQRLASVEIDVRLMAYAGARTIGQIVANGEPGPGASTTRILVTQFEQRLHELALELLGADALLGARDPRAIEGGRWTFGFLRTRASTIGAGTIEIQKNTVAERTLGLPHEPSG